MTLGLAAAGLVVLIMLSALAIGIIRARAHLPDDDWYREPGDTFAADAPARRARHSVARSDADQLAVAVEAGAASLEREWDEPAAAIAGGVVASAQAHVVDLRRRIDARDRGVDDLTVVLFGRTKAGKSSLFAALTAQGFDGIGDGRQNYTRDIRSRRLGAVHLIDAPGVDGVGSEPLEALTTDAVHEADILVTLVTDDAVFQEDFERLRGLCASTRPTVIALNVKQANVQRLVEAPNKVFRPPRLEPHRRRLRKELPDRIRDETPVVIFHALAAERARRSRRSERHALAAERARGSSRKERVAMWRESRVRDVIAAIAEQEPTARRFALSSCDEELLAGCDKLLAACQNAEDEIAELTQGFERTMKEVEDILRETTARTSVGAEVADAHFASAEQDLLVALEVADQASFQTQANRALNQAGLNVKLNEILRETADLLQEKFEDFRADVQLASRVTATRYRFEELHGRVQQERETLDAAKQKALSRKRIRIGAEAVVGVLGAIGVLVFAETGVGAPIVVLIASEAHDTIHRLLPDVDVPQPKQRDRVTEVRRIVTRALSEAKVSFEHALQTQIISPARAHLIAPLQVQITELKALTQELNVITDAIREVRTVVDDRLHLTTILGADNTQ